MSISLLFFASAQSFQGVDLMKGRKFVEPMCCSRGRPLHKATATVIAQARDDAIVYAYTKLSMVNPFPEGTVGFRLYAEVGQQQVEDDYTPYPILPNFYKGLR
jgi:hypothetical protein